MFAVKYTFDYGDEYCTRSLMYLWDYPEPDFWIRYAESLLELGLPEMDII